MVRWRAPGRENEYLYGDGHDDGYGDGEGDGDGISHGYGLYTGAGEGSGNGSGNGYGYGYSCIPCGNGVGGGDAWWVEDGSYPLTLEEVRW